MVRVLCLHGAGTNSKVFQFQTDRLRASLPPHYTYEWIDGEVDCDPAPGVSGVFPGPFLCYHAISTFSEIEDACALVEEIIAEEGPFDAVLGFSQGAALAATLLLDHALSTDPTPPPFRLAIFLGASLPFSRTPSAGEDVTSLFAAGRGMSVDLTEWRRHATTPLPQNGAAEPHISMEGVPVYLQRSILEAAEARKDGTDERDTASIQRFHPEACTARIKVPTVHVIGAKDPFREQSLQLLELCERGLTACFEHEGGHEVPKGPEATAEMRDLILRAVTRSEFIM